MRLKSLLRTIFSLVFTLLSFSPLLQAQEAENELVSYEAVLFSGHFGFSVPVGNLGKKLDDVGFGFGGSLLFLIDKRNPLYLGVDVSHFTYSEAFFITDIFIDGFLVPVEYRTRANILTGHTIFRYAPTVNFFLKPYLDGMFGFKHFVTRTRITDLESSEDDYDQFVENGDWALSYGGAIGFLVPLYYTRNGVGIQLDIRCAYQRGTAADYNVRNDNWIPGTSEPINGFDLENSTTDLLIPKIGVLISFGRKAFVEEAYID